MQIRPIEPDDAERVALLCEQLGYPSSKEQVLRYQALLVVDDDQTILVAEEPAGHVVGWVHVHGHHWLGGRPHARIAGLVVDASQRGRGIGKALLHAAEAWARKRGYEEVVLNSNVVREEAHRFYRDLGYAVVKTQYQFRKGLAAR